jgi:hypothetical protein
MFSLPKTDPINIPLWLGANRSGSVGGAKELCAIPTRELLTFLSHEGGRATLREYGICGQVVEILLNLHESPFDEVLRFP